MSEAVGCALYKGRKILLQKRSLDYKKPGIWTLFGGHVEENEDVKTAAKREMKEELGIEVNDLDYFAQFVTENGTKNRVFSSELKVDLSELKLTEGVGFALFEESEISDNGKFYPYNVMKQAFHYLKNYK